MTTVRQIFVDFVNIDLSNEDNITGFSTTRGLPLYDVIVGVRGCGGCCCGGGGGGTHPICDAVDEQWGCT